MGQLTGGVRAIFSQPRIYDAFQDVMGATRIREELVREFFRPTPGMRVLDIGCGTAEILRFLPQGVDYWGFDISAPYIDAAKARLGGRGHFECGVLEPGRLDDLPRFDLTIALGVLHHLDDEQARDLFNLARKALKPDGRAVTIDPCLVDGQNPIARFLIRRDRGQNVRTAAGYRILPHSSFRDIKGLVRHRSWIPYTHWVMECKG